MSEDKRNNTPPPTPPSDGEGKRYASDNLPTREQRVTPKPEKK